MRKLFTLCSALSLLLCIAACALWVRSYWTADQVRSYRPDVDAARWSSETLSSTRGRLLLSRVRVQYTAPKHARREAREIYAWAGTGPGISHATLEPYWYLPRNPSVLERLGFGVEPYDGARSHFESNRKQAGVYAPHWAIALAAAVPPALWLWRRRADRARRRAGRCPSCGYDLRATPDRCPECGAAADVQRSAAASA